MRRRTASRIAAALALLGIGVPTAASTPHVACDGDRRAVVELRGGDPTRWRLWPEPAAVVRVRERGHELRVETAGTAQLFSVQVPVRRGTWIVVADGTPIELTLAQAVPRQREAVAEIEIVCDRPTVDDIRSWSELHRLSAVADSDRTDVPYATALREARSTQQAVERPLDRALATHLVAQLQFRADRSADALAAFEAAESAWRVAGDPYAAGVARVAQIEELLRLGRTDAVISAPRTGLADQSYWATRHELARCVAWRLAAELAAAEACLRGVTSEFERLDEPIAVASAGMDLADVQRMRSDDAAAEATALAALARARDVDRPLFAGRAELLLGDLATARGEIEVAIGRYRAALDDFGNGAPRWRANTLLRIGNLYRQLGALAEARACVDAALVLLSEKDAPARVAAALVAAAEVARDGDDADSAATMLARAHELYVGLAMPVELDVVRLQQAQLHLERGDLDAAALLVGARDRTLSYAQSRWNVAEAVLHASRRECDSARRLLKQLAGKPVSLDMHVSIERARAVCLGLTEGPAAAETHLRATATRMSRLAAHMRNPLMRLLLAQRIEPLKRDAVELLAKARGGGGELIAWLALDETMVAPASATGPSPHHYDRLVAGDIASSPLAVPSAETSAALLDVLAEVALPPAGASAHGVERLWRLPAGVRFVAHFRGRRHDVVLWVGERGRLDAEVVDTGALAGAMHDLEQGVSNRSVPVSLIEAAATRLAAQLFAGREGEQRPDHLLVHAAGVLRAVPWSLLRWPGADERPLLDTTRVSLLQLVEQAGERRTEPRLDVLVAPGGDRAGLPLLRVAAAEPDLIRAAVGSDRRVNRVVPASRTRVLDALSNAEWVHLSAHGSPPGTAIGFSGAWLERGAGETADFLSWIEILARGVNSRLVVLNACNLSASQARSDAALAFAHGVARAGARDVISAIRPVSDAATSLWIPALYGALRSAPLDPARATMLAQLRLRKSRTFRHPFYWTAYVHISTWGGVDP